MDIGEHYGELKVACEQVATKAYGERALIVRPGLIVGPNDASGRFSYWPHRIARGGEVLAPGAPDAPTQVVDARDLAVWMLDQIDAGTAGTFNAVSPPTTIGTVLDACTKVTGSDAQLRWAPDSFLREHDVGGWDEMPLWVSGPDAVGMTDVRPARVPSRPIEDTIADVLASPPVAGGAALTAGREAELLRQFGFGQPQSREG